MRPPKALFLLGTAAPYGGEHDRAASLFEETLELDRDRGDKAVCPGTLPIWVLPL